MPSLLIFGDPGMGKTKIIEKFLREHPSVYDDKTGMTRSPVAATQMPPIPSEREFYEGLIVSLGSIMPHGVPVNHLRHRFRVLARQMDVRMLIIDEINTMLAGTFREQRVFLNSIRLLANDLKLPLVCVGKQEAKRALMTDQQLADRFAASELPPWRDDRSSDRFDNLRSRWGERDACMRRSSRSCSLFIKLSDFLHEDLGHRILLTAVTLEPNEGAKTIGLAVLGFAIREAWDRRRAMMYSEVTANSVCWRELAVSRPTTREDAGHARSGVRISRSRSRAGQTSLRSVIEVRM
jgi:hypothetical protein